MTHEDYKEARRERGTQAEVAKSLGISRSTLLRRENGELPISREASVAMLTLPAKKADFLS